MMSKPVRTLVLWALLLMMFVAIWQFLSPDPAPHAAAQAEPAGNSWQITASIAGTILALLYAFRRYTSAVQIHNRALNAVAMLLEGGRFDEAERILAPVLASRIAQLRCAALVQRAEIALRRGDRDAVILRAEEALAVPPGRIFKNPSVRLDARSLAGFARASAGDEARARADIEAVRAGREPTAVALARVAIAELVLLDRAGDRQALRDAFERHRSLWLVSCPRRERVLVRAYEAMLDAGSAPIYRQKAAASEAQDRVALAEWVASFAPNVAPFVRGTSLDAPESASASPPEPAPTEAGKRKVEAARPQIPPKKSGSTQSLLLWMLIIVAFIAVWNVGSSSLLGALGVMAISALVAWAAVGIRRQRADGRRIKEGIHAYGLGDFERADAVLSFTPKSASQRVHAHHFRADIALCQGRMADALVQVDKAFLALAEAHGGKVAAPQPVAEGVVSWDFPRVLTAQRSQALAVLGRHDEARAELAWANGLPSKLPSFRVRLIEILAGHDYEGAARLVETRPVDLAPAARDEALYDLICFVARPSARSEVEAARLRSDLRRTVTLRPWIEAVAPGLVAAFEAAASEGADGRQIAATP
ncbi:hypothetical protein A7982_12520 [Minicystis rosea]|nr:hypothetical protein A7982_12520 [Minicystis rosea]